MNGCMCIIMNVYILVYVCAHTYNYESVHTHGFIIIIMSVFLERFSMSNMLNCAEEVQI